MNTPSTIYASLFFLSTIACGGATPEPVAAEEPAVNEELPEPTEVTEPVESEEPASDEPEGPSGGRTPKDMVGAESSRFVLSFTSSDVGMKAEERCDMKYSSDPRARSQCMKSARSKVKDDVLEFEQNQSGRWVWTTSTQRGSSLRRMKQVNFTWGEETKNSVEIKPSKGSKVVIGVPNNYSIVLQNPKHGKLVYDAKLSE